MRRQAMRRLYFLTASLNSTEQISLDLHKQGISDWNFHVHGRDEAGLYKRHVHSSNYLQRLDIIRYGERGALIGFGCALCAIVWVMLKRPFGPEVSWLVYVAIFGFITLFGAWVGGLTGIASENQELAEFQTEIRAGNFVVMIDVDPKEEHRVRELMAQQHPKAQFKRGGSTFVNPFKFRPKEKVSKSSFTHM